MQEIKICKNSREHMASLKQYINLNKLITNLFPSLLLAANIFLIIPFTVYSGNSDEFIVPLGVFLKERILHAFLSVAILSFIGLQHTSEEGIC